jgi:hypothetical protein
MTNTLTEQQIRKIIENVTGKAAKVCKQKFYGKPKSLTEQWREGTLRGCFYWKLPSGNICTAYTDIMRDIKNVKDSDEVEVLQEAPSYVEYKRLQKQLNEANKLIKWVVKTSWPGNQEEDDFDRYLEKWGVK